MATIRSVSNVSLTELKDVVLRTKIRYLLPRRKSRFGRPGFYEFSMLLGYILWIRERIPSVAELGRKLGDNSSYQEFCGFDNGKVPSHDTLSRFFSALTLRRQRKIFYYLDKLLARTGVFDQDDLALDATDILSNGRNRHNPDSEAGFGHKSDGERFFGYWALFLVGTESEMVRDVEVTPANIHQSMTAQRIFKHLTPIRKRNAVLFHADAAFDDRKSYTAIIEKEMVPLISYNPRKAKIKNFLRLKKVNWRYRAIGEEGVRLWKREKHNRGSVERYNSTFKQLLGGRNVPVRGLDKVTRHILGAAILSQLCGLAIVSRRNSQKLPRMPSLLDFFSSPSFVTTSLCTAII